MGMSGEKAQNQQANTLMASTNTSIDKAATVDPALQQMRDYWMKIKDWETGKSGPIDVRNMPGSDVDIGLFNDAKVSHDAGRIGKGLGTMTDGGNPLYTAALDKEMAQDRDLQASGMLENSVETKVANANAALTGIGTQQQQQNLNVAGLRGGLYKDYLNRPIQPGFGQQLAMGAMSAVGQIGGGLASYGGLAAL